MGTPTKPPTSIGPNSRQSLSRQSEGRADRCPAIEAMETSWAATAGSSTCSHRGSAVSPVPNPVRPLRSPPIRAPAKTSPGLSQSIEVSSLLLRGGARGRHPSAPPCLRGLSPERRSASKSPRRGAAADHSASWLSFYECGHQPCRSGFAGRDLPIPLCRRRVGGIGDGHGSAPAALPAANDAQSLASVAPTGSKVRGP
jgi:hypothetical protein